MCGRYKFSPANFADLRVKFDIQGDVPLFSSFNIAPTRNVPVIIRDERQNRANLFQWGLVPSWSKDSGSAVQMINARAETVGERPAFKELLKHRRCLVLADGFYEWRKEREYKIPMLFKLASGEPFAFAGLWDAWTKRDGSVLKTVTIITTKPNRLMAPIHERMPVILGDNDAQAWIGHEKTTHAVSLLKPFPAELMETHDVAPLVNDARCDEAACAERVDASQLRGTQRSFDFS